MAPFDDDLQACIEIVLGVAPPAPDYEPLRFLRQWLAERNLGLVPIADAASFDWPGHWLARVRTADGDHAVVMYGSPSGPLHDPAGGVSDGGAVQRGGVLGRLVVHLLIRETHGPDR